MGLGYNARPSASNSVVIGNSSVTSIGGYAGWSNLSDARYKKNVQDNVPGLEFIKLLKPVTYQLEINKLAVALKEDQVRDEHGNIVMKNPDVQTKASRDAKERIIMTGFIAQDVEEAANSIGYKFSGVDAPQNENDFYALRYSDFVVPLVKAVQEQQEIIENQNQELKEMQKEIAELKSLIKKTD
jgi:hypothetical protein